MKFTPAILFALFAPLLSAGAAEKIRVVSFSTILTEIAQKVGGDRVSVTGLVRANVDPHEYEPTPDDLKQVAGAHLILLSARQMENYLTKLREVSAGHGKLVDVGNRFPSLRKPAVAGGPDMSPGKKGTAEDPHWWHSIENMKRATIVVRDELAGMDTADKAVFAANADAYIEELDALQKWAKSEVAKLPRNKRRLVTSHDAFGWFAPDFGFTVHPISGVTPEEEPSSRQVAELIATIKTEGVKAVFFESIENPKVAKEITRETGAVVGGTLYADGLGEGDAATYDGMFRHNVTTIVNALK